MNARRPHPPPTALGLSTQTIATMLCVASIGELLILRIGTRTAIHIPDIEAVYTPFRVVAATGRAAFSIAVVLLVVLLGRLILDLHRNDATATAFGVAAFVCAAAVGRLGVIAADIVGVVTIAVVIACAVLALVRLRDGTASALFLFAIAYSAAALTSVLPSVSVFAGAGLTERSEQLAMFAALASGPAVRHSLDRPLAPSPRLAAWAGTIGIAVTAAIVANASTTHILMLWNFGLTGALPAVVYGLAATSLTVAVGSSFRHRGASMAAGLTFVIVGGVGLISTYQSGLTIAGLALCTLSAGPRRPVNDELSAAAALAATPRQG